MSSHTRGCKLHGERDAVQSPADFRYDRCVVISESQGVTAIGDLSHEELYRRVAERLCCG